MGIEGFIAKVVRRFAAPLALLLCLLLVLPRSPSGLEITALDVGQGDGLVLRADGQVVTVDIGSTSNRKLGENVAEPYLKSQGISRIDAALVSHADADHVSGLLYLLQEAVWLEIGMVVLPEPAQGDARYDALRETAGVRGAAVHYMGAGDALVCGEVQFRCYYPAAGAVYEEDPNKHSTALHVNYRDFDLLLTGDMDQDCERQMLENMRQAGVLIRESTEAGQGVEEENQEREDGSTEIGRGREDDGVENVREKAGGEIENGHGVGNGRVEKGRLDVLKAGHHGSNTSTSPELLAQLAPEYALISYGRDNSYGHPHREVVERLETSGAKLLETGIYGRIRIRTDGEEIWWEGYR